MWRHISSSGELQLGEHRKCKQRQIRKFAVLKEAAENVVLSPKWMRNSSQNTNFNKEKWVVNLSSKKLTSAETKVLQYGLNFSPNPAEIPVSEIITETEFAIKRLRYTKSIVSHSVAEFRTKVTRCLKSAKLPKTISHGKKDRHLATSRRTKTSSFSPWQGSWLCCTRS